MGQTFTCTLGLLFNFLKKQSHAYIEIIHMHVGLLYENWTNVAHCFLSPLLTTSDKFWFDWLARTVIYTCNGSGVPWNYCLIRSYNYKLLLSSGNLKNISFKIFTKFQNICGGVFYLSKVAGDMCTIFFKTT